MTVTVTVDTTPPAAPTVTAPENGTITNTNPLSFVGTGEPGATITITNGSGDPICTALVNESRAWTCTPTLPLPEGEQTVNVTQTDPAGNKSDPTPVTVTVDITSPAAPTVTEPISGTVTNVNPPTFVGTGEPGATIEVTDDEGTLICTTTVDENNDWTCAPTSPLPEGEQTVNVTQTDPAGNKSDPTPVTVTVDTTPPTNLIVTTPVSDTTIVNPPIFVGTGEPGAKIEITDDKGTLICTTTVDESGDWTCAPTSPLPEGEQTVNVTQIDPAGNKGEPTPVKIDATKPATVTYPISGTVTVNNRPTFIGTGEPGTTVTITDASGDEICSTTVGTDGDWTCTSSLLLPDGEQTVSVVVTDLEGNKSAPISITLDVGTSALSIAKTAVDINNTPLIVGDEILYTVIVTNELGASQANVVITDAIPANTTYVAGSAAVTEGSVSDSGPLVADVGTLAAGASATLTFRVTVDAGTVGATIQNSAQAASPEQSPPVEVGPIEPAGGGKIVASADLSLAQSIEFELLDTNFIIVVTNNGASAAPGAVVSVTFPVEFENVEWTCEGSNCPNASGSGNTLNETLSSFPSGDSVTYTVNTKVIGRHANAAEVIPPAEVFDYDMSNNSGSQFSSYLLILPIIYNNASFD